MMSFVKPFPEALKQKSDDGFFHNTLVKSIYIEPNSEHTEYMVVSKKKMNPLSFAEYESMIKAAESADTNAAFNEAGKNIIYQRRF